MNEPARDDEQSRPPRNGDSWRSFGPDRLLQYAQLFAVVVGGFLFLATNLAKINSISDDLAKFEVRIDTGMQAMNRRIDNIQDARNNR